MQIFLQIYVLEIYFPSQGFVFPFFEHCPSKTKQFKLNKVYICVVYKN